MGLLTDFAERSDMFHLQCIDSNLFLPDNGTKSEQQQSFDYGFGPFQTCYTRLWDTFSFARSRWREHRRRNLHDHEERTTSTLKVQCTLLQ